MAKDPYRYFRIEARELIDGLAKEMLELERSGGPDAVNRLLRLAHTLKGAARVVRQAAIAELAHGIEDALVPLRQAPRPATTQEIDACLTLVDRMRAALDTIDQPPPSGVVPADAPAPAPAPAPGQAYGLRIDSAQTDALAEGLAGAGRELQELGASLAGLADAEALAWTLASDLEPQRRQQGQAEWQRAHGQARALGATLERTRRSVLRHQERLQRSWTGLRADSERLRLQGLAGIFSPLERVARDAANELQRQVRWLGLGGELGADAGVLTALAEALPHAVRNAVAHGIESPERRSAAGKPAEGTVRLHCARRGSQLLLTLSDDGAGIDFAAVRAAAQVRGLIAPTAQVADADLAVLLLHGGLSTSTTVSGMSGRGVGLDAVRSVVEGLRGTITLSSERGRGTTLELLVPASLASAPSLIAHAGGSLVAIPLDAVTCAVRINEAAVVRTAQGTAFVLGERTIPMLSLGRLIGSVSASPAGEARSLRTVVVLRSGEHEAAVEVGFSGRHPGGRTAPLPCGSAAGGPARRGERG